jgi:hypothetical protein
MAAPEPWAPMPFGKTVRAEHSRHIGSSVKIFDDGQCGKRLLRCHPDAVLLLEVEQRARLLVGEGVDVCHDALSHVFVNSRIVGQITVHSFLSEARAREQFAKQCHRGLPPWPGCDRSIEQSTDIRHRPEQLHGPIGKRQKAFPLVEATGGGILRIDDHGERGDLAPSGALESVR